MRKKSLKLFVVVGVIFLSSCEKEFDITQQGKREMTVNCLLDNLRYIKVYLTQSSFIGESRSSVPIIDARVELYKNDSFVALLNYYPIDSVNNFGSYIFSQFSEPENKYSVKITHPTYGSITGEDYIHRIPVVADYRLYSQVTQNGKNVDAFRFRFTDDVYTENYYLLTIWSIGSQWRKIGENDSVLERFGVGSRPDLLTSLPDTVRDHEQYILFSDKGFNGLEKEVDFRFTTIDSSTVHTDTLVVELQSVSKTHYDYVKSQTNYRNSSLFSQPSDVFSNIRNGLGIFMTSGIKQMYTTIKK
jgi:hypothetical protein